MNGGLALARKHCVNSPPKETERDNAAKPPIKVEKMTGCFSSQGAPAAGSSRVFAAMLTHR